MKTKCTRLLAGILLSLLITGCFESKRNEGIWPSDDAESFPYAMYVSSEGLNVRQQPDAGSSINGVLFQNDKVITDKVSNGGWYRIRAADESVEGYVNAKYLADKPLSEEEIAAERAAAEAVIQKTSEEEQVSVQETETASGTQPQNQTQPETRSAIIDDVTAIPETPRPKLRKLSNN